jgi:hypothetical protein
MVSQAVGDEQGRKEKQVLATLLAMMRWRRKAVCR